MAPEKARILPFAAIAVLFALSIPALLVLGRAPTGQTPKPPTDLDELMDKVLAKRELDWGTLRRYVFREKEVLEMTGTGRAPKERSEREYIWLVRDGYLVRSPLAANGAGLSAKAREKAEREWLRNGRTSAQSRLSHDAFFGFKFHAGQYLLAGRQTFEGREVLIVKYLPKFPDPSIFRKTKLVTMLVFQPEHQLVRMTFDNVGLDFLPRNWVCDLDEMQAEMTMHKPFNEVWLPREIHAVSKEASGTGVITLRYDREFYDYEKADVKVRFWYERSNKQRRHP